MKHINISQVSTFFVNGSYPIEFLFFYPYKINTNKLRRALKKISKYFWPAFGVYSNGQITEKPYIENDCFDESIIDELFDTITNHDAIYYNFGSLIPENIPRLFYLKVIHYNNGTVLIPKMNHLIGDGYSYFYLLTVLANVTKRVNIPAAPFFINTLFRPKIKNSIDKDFHFTATPNEAITYDEKLEVELMEVEKNEVRNQAKEISESSGLRISTNDVICANVVKFIANKREDSLTEDFKLMIPVDVRRGVSELGQRYFGNGLIMYSVPITPEEAIQMNTSDLAIKIRKTFPDINLQNFKFYLEKIEGWIKSGQLELLRPYDPDTECLVTNLTRMPIKRLDFGSGPPTFIEPLTRGRSGAAILAKDNKFVLRLAQ
jgi:hypothetical protein